MASGSQQSAASSAEGEVPLELIARYDRPGPRYTSYPPATEWTALGPSDAHAALERVARDPRPISLYVHLPFCERMCLFCGCNVIAGRSRERVPRYLQALEREAAMVAAVIGRREVVQLHFGGGTPTFLTPGELEQLGRALASTFALQPHAEAGIELDPMVTTRAHLESAREVGFNRMSVGVQDFQDDVQALIERCQPDAQSAETIALGRELGFQSINIDLMYGLPGQTPAHLAHSARRGAELGADRVALFGYAHVPWVKPNQKRLEAHGIPLAPQRWEMFNAARSVLLTSGYVPIGFDHFAKPTDELARAFAQRRLRRNFQGYTVLAPTDLIGLGVSAISEAGGAFLQNTKSYSEYCNAIESGELATEKGLLLTADDELRRAIILDLMCNLHVEFESIEQRFAIDFRQTFAKELVALEGLIADGLAHCDGQGLTITERGRVFMRNVAMCFDSYLAGKTGERRFSRTV